MNRLDPLWLQSFVAVARHGSVTQAAQRVHRTQSAVSTHLKQLESALGVSLAERTTRSVRLTTEGERFLPYAQRLLDLQGAACAAVRPQESPTVWRLGISEYFLPNRLPELLALVQELARGARLELLWAGSSTLQRLWQAGEMDLAVVTSASPPAGSRVLRREPLAWVAAPGHLPSPERPVSLVLLGPDCPVREMALGALARSGIAHHVRLTCSGSQAAVTAIRAGWGVGCLNRSAVPSDLVPLSRGDARRWGSPGRLAFHLLARPNLQPLANALMRWAGPRESL